MAALFSVRRELSCVAVEVIYCPASLADSSCHVAVRGMNAVSISLMSCSPSHAWGCQTCEMGTVLAPRDSCKGLVGDVCWVT